MFETSMAKWRILTDIGARSLKNGARDNLATKLTSTTNNHNREFKAKSCKTVERIILAKHLHLIMDSHALFGCKREIIDT